MPTRLVPTLVLAATLTVTACGSGVTTSDEPTEPTQSTETTAPTESSEPTVTSEPTEASDPTATTPPPAATPACSTDGSATDGADLDGLPAAVREVAMSLLEGAVRCDEEQLASAATEDGTSLSFGDVTPEQAFSLPVGDERYVAIVTLLTKLPYAADSQDGSTTYVWPRVHAQEWADSDEAWQEVADAGLHDAALLADMREAGSGYLGWRLGITEDGTWQFLIAGD